MSSTSTPSPTSPRFPSAPALQQLLRQGPVSRKPRSALAADNLTAGKHAARRTPLSASLPVALSNPRRQQLRIAPVSTTNSLGKGRRMCIELTANSYPITKPANESLLCVFPSPIRPIPHNCRVRNTAVQLCAQLSLIRRNLSRFLTHPARKGSFSEPVALTSTSYTDPVRDVLYEVPVPVPVSVSIRVLPRASCRASLSKLVIASSFHRTCSKSSYRCFGLSKSKARTSSTTPSVSSSSCESIAHTTSPDSRNLCCQAHPTTAPAVPLAC
ncbi:hypothetical protein B0T19DRAFT_130862 [Cercophora scortea]|uniref:Uncharacterized protein n=1 Tax=Cercophora scortea TaxID=314031 RepID=A0AAE0MJP8_9PEZI|nr:hypothetical protein B0T19DRAFT_130862 [Cercophora scortea]